MGHPFASNVFRNVPIIPNVPKRLLVRADRLGTLNVISIQADVESRSICQTPATEMLNCPR